MGNRPTSNTGNPPCPQQPQATNLARLPEPELSMFSPQPRGPCDSCLSFLAPTEQFREVTPHLMAASKDSQAATGHLVTRISKCLYQAGSLQSTGSGRLTSEGKLYRTTWLFYLALFCTDEQPVGEQRPPLATNAATIPTSPDSFTDYNLLGPRARS